jgi:hypothetical protein
MTKRAFPPIHPGEILYCSPQNLQYTLSISILHAYHRITSTCDRYESLLQLLRMDCCQTQPRLENTRLMAPNPVGRVETIISQFFQRDNRAFTIWEFHCRFVFCRPRSMQPLWLTILSCTRRGVRDKLGHPIGRPPLPAGPSSGISVQPAPGL